MSSTPVPTAVVSPTPHAPRFRALDGLRLVGALAVLTTHVGFESGAALDRCRLRIGHEPRDNTARGCGPE